jgi:hypothetical protein
VQLLIYSSITEKYPITGFNPNDNTFDFVPEPKKKKNGENMGRNSPSKPSSGYESLVVFKKNIIDTYNIIGSECRRAGVDEETTLVCHQRR